MISLPDSDDVPVDLFLPSPAASCLALSPAVGHKLTLYLVVFKIIFFVLFFSQTQLAIPAKQTRPAAQSAMHFPAEKQPGLQHIRSSM